MLHATNNIQITYQDITGVPNIVHNNYHHLIATTNIVIHNYHFMTVVPNIVHITYIVYLFINSLVGYFLHSRNLLILLRCINIYTTQYNIFYLLYLLVCTQWHVSCCYH